MVAVTKQEGTLARVDAGGNFEQEEVLEILPLVVSEPRKRPNGSKADQRTQRVQSLPLRSEL